MLWVADHILPNVFICCYIRVSEVISCCSSRFCSIANFCLRRQLFDVFERCN
nr:ionotropic receptor [Semanotus bifasciatus]